LLQDFLDKAPAGMKVQLVEELKGHVQEAWDSQVALHANHVFQKFIQVMPPEHCQFVHEELLESNIDEVAHNMYGCRILQRIIEHFRPQDMEPLLNRLLQEEIATKLIMSRYGNYVMQCILEHVPPAQKGKIVNVLLASLAVDSKIAKNKHGSHVVQCTLKHCSEKERRDLADALVGRAAEDRSFRSSLYGSFVLKEAQRFCRKGEPHE